MLEREIDFIKRHKNIFKVIEKISENPLTWQVILFGSYSKRTENKQSDIDLLVSCIPGKEKEVENFVKSLKYDTNIEFSLVVLSMHELSNIKKDNPELWQDLREFGIIFKGEDSFYYQMYKNGR
jgi:predicted nucleotidyltransferase